MEKSRIKNTVIGCEALAKPLTVFFYAHNLIRGKAAERVLPSSTLFPCAPRGKGERGKGKGARQGARDQGARD